MLSISYARHRFSPVVIQHAVRLHVRFALSYRDVEDLLAERGLKVLHETIRRWVLKAGCSSSDRPSPVAFGASGRSPVHGGTSTKCRCASAVNPCTCGGR